MNKLIITFTLFFLSLTGFSQTINLTGWKFKTGDNAEYAKPGFDDAQWQVINPGICWEQQGYPSYDGYAWYRVTFRLSAELKKNPHATSIRFQLGKIDDNDETFLNGKQIGKTTSWEAVRDYSVAIDDPALLWDKDNILAIRVLDNVGNGGMYSLPVNVTCNVSALKDYLVLDVNSKELETKPGGMKSKTIILKNTASFDVKGKLTTEITDEETGKVAVSFKSKPIQKVKVSYTFIEAETGNKLSKIWSSSNKSGYINDWYSSKIIALPSVTTITKDQVSAEWQGKKAILKPGEAIGPWTLMSILPDSKPLPMAVFENFTERNGQMLFVDQNGVKRTFDKSVEATFPTDSSKLYNGHTLKEVLDNPVDILGKEVLAKSGDPTYDVVAPILTPLIWRFS
jgi:hypothetical protein